MSNAIDEQKNRDEAAQQLRTLADRVIAGKVDGLVLHIVHEHDDGSTALETWKIGSKQAIKIIEANHGNVPAPPSGKLN
jgi:hypothetical protein